MNFIRAIFFAVGVPIIMFLAALIWWLIVNWLNRDEEASMFHKHEDKNKEGK